MKKFNNQFATQKLRSSKELDEEGSVTGGGEAYLPGLDVPEKKYKGPKEVKASSGYKKVKGFRPGHTKDKGGFQYKDMWGVNEAELTQELKENYSRFKKETRIKTESQQIHAAMRLAEKKLAEANRILEYTSQLRRELAETKYSSHTHKVMERMVKSIAEAYQKMKQLK